MNLKRTSIAILAVAGLLALSPAGRAQTNTPPAAGGRQGGGAGRGNPEAQLTRYKEQLKLTDAQVPKVKAVIEERTKKMQELRTAAPEERRSKMQALMEEENKKMKEILTPDQFKKYEEMQQQVRGRAGNRRQGGAGGNGAPGAGAGGGQQQQ